VVPQKRELGPGVLIHRGGELGGEIAPEKQVEDPADATEAGPDRVPQLDPPSRSASSRINQTGNRTPFLSCQTIFLSGTT